MSEPIILRPVTRQKVRTTALAHTWAIPKFGFDQNKRASYLTKTTTTRFSTAC